jgi:hypothetical protein
MHRTSSPNAHPAAKPAIAVATAAVLVVAFITPDASGFRPCRASAARSGRSHNITRCLTHSTWPRHGRGRSLAPVMSRQQEVAMKHIGWRVASAMTVTLIALAVPATALAGGMAGGVILHS